MIKRIIDFYLKPYNLPKTKIYLFGILAMIFVANIFYVKISRGKDLIEILSDSSTPTIILVGIVITFLYMIFVDSNYARRNQENNQLIISVVNTSNISDHLKEKLIEKIS